jgi:hypothetical protein
MTSTYLVDELPVTRYQFPKLWQMRYPRVY